MTGKEIAERIINSYKTDSGIVMGIPANCQNVLARLLELAANMARSKGNCRTCNGTGRVETCPSCQGSGWLKDENRDWLD